MSTRRRPRSDPRPALHPVQYVERLRSAGAEELVQIGSWAGITVTVQLPPTWLAAGRLPELRRRPRGGGPD